MDRATLRPTVLKALQAGAKQLTPISFEWDVAGRCQSPVRVSLTGRALRRQIDPYGISKKTGSVYGWINSRYERDVSIRDHNAPMFLDMDVRCRKCPNCLAARKRLWQGRILTEITAAQRTWFGTLTLSPHEHYLSQCRGSVEFAGLSPLEMSVALHKANTEILTLYVKRLRKAATGRLRLCLVMEPHKSGYPHYHALVHETHGAKILKKDLQSQWPHGFSSWKLVEDATKGSWYVAKYLSKTIGARVRASKSYGDIHTALAIEGSDHTLVKTKSPPLGKIEKLTPKTERTE